MHALANEFVEIKIAGLKRVLASVRSCQREEILDDMRVQRLSGIAGKMPQQPIGGPGQKSHLADQLGANPGNARKVERRSKPRRSRRQHIERRYSMPWSHPVARMEEFIAAIRAIWASWVSDPILLARTTSRPPILTVAPTT